MSLAWRLALLGLGLGIAFPCITSAAVSAVPGRQAGMAAAGNNAFRQVGSSLGPAVLHTLLATEAVDTLPGHLADAGLSGGAARSILEAVEANGLGAVARMELGADAGRALGAVSEAFHDGLRLCLTVSATLLVLAALAAAVLLRRRPDRSVTVGGSTNAATPGTNSVTGPTTPESGPSPVRADPRPGGGPRTPPTDAAAPPTGVDRPARPGSPAHKGREPGRASLSGPTMP
ncbi:hypothetical protein ACFVAF_23185 [Streptomyces sp. NPDC057596]|uniref:hypothetical protein n=1 Tax=Streptomyces sp. NPDC057596 TaxID=3346178 RepID=UPI0036921282